MKSLNIIKNFIKKFALLTALNGVSLVIMIVGYHIGNFVLDYFANKEFLVDMIKVLYFFILFGYCFIYLALVLFCIVYLFSKDATNLQDFIDDIGF